MSEEKPTIALVIDDEVQIRRLLRLTLEANGYKVYEAATGQDGLLEAAQRRPEVVVLDLGLPDLDGVTVLNGCANGAVCPCWCCPCATATRTKSPRWTTARTTT